MASLDTLPPDQRAVLDLVLQRGRSYDDIARLLAIDRAAVRARALAALDQLGPDTGVPPERRAVITDYLLGQLPETLSAQTRERLAQSPSERAWARVLASELASGASKPLPDIPSENSRAPERIDAPPQDAPEPASPAGGQPAASPAGGDEPPASRAGGELAASRAGGDEPPTSRAGGELAASRAGGDEPPASPAGGEPVPAGAEPVSAAAGEPGPADAARRGGWGRRERGRERSGSWLRERPSSRTGGAIMLAIGALIVVAVVVVLVAVLGGGSNKHPTTSAGSAARPSTTASSGTHTTTTSGTSTNSAHIISQINLNPPSGSSAKGVAFVVKAGSAYGIILAAQHVAPNSHNAYAVWLYNSPTDSLRLGFVSPAVGKAGTLQVGNALPTNAGHYHELLLTLETQSTPKTPGPVVLAGAFKGIPAS